MNKRTLKRYLGYAGVALSLVFLGQPGLQAVLETLSSLAIR